ncbi:SusC/RagA family TonB-linked outer membrane protein [Mucilaginibacter angelicae]|uniref:SusC/RagA family TonB-linked outer membrane protein n=1 Tax=Mucilaginibacter angelicae TaxID=869718 RepID=A0ABV6KZW0_9SPHI
MMKFSTLLKMVRLLVLINMVVLLGNKVYAQNTAAGKEVSGMVTDEEGLPMPGVSVLIKGTANGTATSTKGSFKISVPDNNAVLIFSFLGYESKTVTVGGASTVNVRLFPDKKTRDLNEVVVVGYGTQKKESLTGAVASVKGADLVKSPEPNLSNSFAGRVPGVIGLNSSGEPGYDGSSLLIRGRSTTGDNSPLVVIDGVANRLGGLERLNPNDIESVSVLKDASAAIYGAQAANGVILITTKKGKLGTPTLTYSYNQGWNQPTNLPRMADAKTFATIQNELAYYNNPAGGLNQTYSAADIAKFGDGTDPISFPNTNWEKEVLKSVALQDKQDLTVRGGTDIVDYYFSLGNQYQDGLYKNGATKYRQNNVLGNVGVKVNERMKLGLEMGYRQEKRITPAGIGAGTIFGLTYNQYPTIPAFYPNGLPSQADAGGQNPAVMVNGNTVGTLNGAVNVFNGTLTGSYQLPVKGLSLDGFVAVDQSISNSKQFSKPWVTYQYNKTTHNYDVVKAGPSAPNLSQGTETISLVTTNVKLNYARRFGAHNVSAFFAVEQSQTNESTFSAQRYNFLSTDLPELSQGGPLPTDLGNSGGSYRTARQNYFGRINYDYKDKYLAEFQLRDDGSTVFPPGKRFGLFPGVSLGWRISSESWLKDSKVVNSLKLRASYGRLGNDRVSTYQYLDNFAYQQSLATGVPPVSTTGISYNKIGNPNITWEVANKYNIGLDATVLNDFSVVLNWFKEKRSNILAQRSASIPGVSGITSDQIPDENIGSIQNQGFEVEINYTKKLNDFSFNVGGNFTYNKNKVLFLDEAPNTLPYQKYTSLPLGSDLFYQAEGVFKTQAEIDAYPHLPGTIPGDLKYLDYNKDGQITASDRVRSNKSNVPEIVYGITAGAAYKNFDLSILFSGQAKVVQYLLPDAGTIANFPSSWADNRWSPTNTGGTYPRADDRSGTFYGNYRSTFWLRNTSFLRLKNVQLGYNLPRSFVSKIKLSGVRIYASGFNLLTFTSLKDYDPEGNNETGYFYPQQKIYNLGVNVTF